MSRAPIITFVALSASLALLAGCATGFGRDDAIASFMRAHPDASTNQATCVIDELIERFEPAPVDDTDLAVIEAELTALDPAEDFEIEQFRASYLCGMTAEVKSQLEEEFRARGVGPEAAACIADELGNDLEPEDLDVLLTGEMNDAFFAEFFDASEACGTLP